LGTPRRFFKQHLPHQVADVDDFGVGDLVENSPGMASGDDDASIAQHAQVSGDRRLRLPDQAGDLTRTPRPIPQDVNDFDTRGVGHAATEIRLDLEDRAL
jgi:hypothetical protein